MKKEATVPAPTKEESKELVTAAQSLESWGTTEVSTKDIIIPRILLMQPMSEKVTAGEAAFGEFRESLNNEKLGGFEQPITVVPFHLQKVFVEYDNSDPEDKKFIRTVPITAQNEDLPFEEDGEDRDGNPVPLVRDRRMNFYVLLPHEIDQGGAIPYILSFRRTSLVAGKKLATQMFAKNPMAGKSPASVTMLITAGKQSQDKKTWAVMDVKPMGPTQANYVEEAFKWLKIVRAGQAKVHEESYSEEASTVKTEAKDVGEPTGF